MIWRATLRRSSTRTRSFPGEICFRDSKRLPARNRRLSKRAGSVRTRRQRKRLDPSLHEVQPNSFDRDNVLAAVRRMHAWMDAKRDDLPQAVVDEFEPFKPHIDLVWEEVLKLLDSDDRFVSAAAESLVHRAQPLSETAIHSLVDRLHAGDTRLESILKKHTLSPQRCQDMCDRLVSGRFEPGFGKNQHTYRQIVCQQGTDEQVWTLLRHAQAADRTWACRELIQRGLLDKHDPRVYEVEAADCMSHDPGRYIPARFDFAKSSSHQAWFLSRYAALAPETRWAVVEAMELFRADLTRTRTHCARESPRKNRPC